MEIQRVTVGINETNCYILSLPGRNDAVVIDPGDQGRVIQTALAGREPAAILLTHGHCDHINALGDFADVPIVIHPADEIMLRDEEWSLASAFGMHPAVKSSAMVFAQEGSLLRYAGMEITVLHLPGHTLGSVAYRVGNALFSGDTLFRQGYGRTDFPGGDFSALRQSIRRLLSIEENLTVYPGHGEATTLEEERRHYQ